MARRKRLYNRKNLADTVYNDELVAKFINCMMYSGAKSISEGIFYGALEVIKKRHGEEGIEIFYKALSNVRPMLEVRSRRVGGANYQIPTEVRPVRQDSLAIRWLVQYARARSEKTMIQKLANEIYDASQNRGGAIKKREDTHKMAEANRAFAHYRW